MRITEITTIPDYTEERDWQAFSPPWVKRAYKVVGQLNDIEIRAFDDAGMVRIAGFVNDKIMSYLSLMHQEFGHHVQALQVSSDYRKQGLAQRFYSIALKDLGLTLISDSEQTSGGQAMWKKLITSGIDVDVIDMSSGKSYDVNDDLNVYERPNLRYRAKA